MLYNIEKFTQGVWFQMESFEDKGLALAELQLLRTIRLDGYPLGTYRLTEVPPTNA